MAEVTGIMMDVDPTGRICIFGTTMIKEMEDLTQAVLSPNEEVTPIFRRNEFVLMHGENNYHIKACQLNSGRQSSQDPLQLLKYYFSKSILIEKLEVPMVGFSISRGY